MDIEKNIEALLASQDCVNTHLAIQLIESTLGLKFDAFLRQRKLQFKALEWGDEDDFYSALKLGSIRLFYELRTTYQPYVGTSKTLRRQYILKEGDTEHYPESLQWKKDVRHIQSSVQIRQLVQSDYLTLVPTIVRELMH
jgi:hypothetical protein